MPLWYHFFEPQPFLVVGSLQVTTRTVARFTPGSDSSSPALLEHAAVVLAGATHSGRGLVALAPAAKSELHVWGV